MNDEKTIPGYEIIHKPRTNCKRQSGGIAIAIEHKFSKYVTYVPTDCEQLLWCKVDKKILKLDSDVFIASCYIPPESSNYVRASCFDDIEKDILLFSSYSKYVMIKLNSYF